MKNHNWILFFLARSRSLWDFSLDKHRNVSVFIYCWSVWTLSSKSISAYWSLLRTKVHSETDLLSVIRRRAARGTGPGPAFVSSHPLCMSSERLLSPAFGPSPPGEARPGRTGELLLAEGGGEEGTLPTKRLSLVWDKLLENQWDEAERSFTASKELLFDRCGGTLFFPKDAETRETESLSPEAPYNKRRKWNPTSSDLQELLSCGLVHLRRETAFRQKV